MVKPREGYLNISNLEEAWNAVFTSETPAGAPVLLDLSENTYLDQEVLLYLVAILTDRAPFHLETLIELPLRGREPVEQAPPADDSDLEPEISPPDHATPASDEPEAEEAPRDRIVEFLHSWQLPRAVELATKRDFTDFLTETSRARLAAVTPQDSQYTKVMETRYNGRQSMLPETYFALTPIKLGAGPAAAAAIVTKDWLDAHIVSVLDRYLNGLGSRVGSYILHETIVNAARHPGATVAFTSAQVMYKRYEHEDAIPRELVLAVWDDGNSFADTLASGLGGAGVRSPAYGAEEDEFTVQFADRDDEHESRPIHLVSGQETLPTGDPDLIVAAFMLGITAIPDDRNRDEEAIAMLKALSEDLLPPGLELFGGLGLHLVRRNVIDLFGGSIQYISGGYRLSLLGEGQTGKYRGFLTKRELLGPQARGNLLVVRLPLGDRPKDLAPPTERKSDG